MGKRRWIVILAVVAIITLLIAGTAYAAQGGNGPLNRTGSTITPSTTCITCTPSTICTGDCAQTQTSSTVQTQTQQRLQDATCDGTCDGAATTDQSRQRAKDGTGTASGRGYGHGNGR